MAIKRANVAADVTIMTPTVELAEMDDFLERAATSGSSFYFSYYSFSSKAFVFNILASALSLMFSNSTCIFLASGSKIS